MTPDEAAAAVAALAASEAALAGTLARLDDTGASGPSLLPGWTRAVLVRHLAVNARTNAVMIGSVLRGQPRPQYADPNERERLIEAGRGRPAAEVVADALAAADEFAAAVARVGPAEWDLTAPAGVGEVPLHERVVARRFEVEVHHADLDLGYRYEDWPADFTDGTLRRLVAGLPGRTAELHPGSWGIAADDGPAWTLFAAEPVVSVVEGLTDGVRGTVAGPRWALAAWLLGRGDAASLGLRTSGDDAVAGLARWFPYG